MVPWASMTMNKLGSELKPPGSFTKKSANFSVFMYGGLKRAWIIPILFKNYQSLILIKPHHFEKKQKFYKRD